MRPQHSPPETGHHLQKDLVFSSVIWGQMLFQMFLCQECELWRSKEKQGGKKTPQAGFSTRDSAQDLSSTQPVTRATGTSLTECEFCRVTFEKHEWIFNKQQNTLYLPKNHASVLPP